MSYILRRTHAVGAPVASSRTTTAAAAATTVTIAEKRRRRRRGARYVQTTGGVQAAAAVENTPSRARRNPRAADTPGVRVCVRVGGGTRSPSEGGCPARERVRRRRRRGCRRFSVRDGRARIATAHEHTGRTRGIQRPSPPVTTTTTATAEPPP